MRKLFTLLSAIALLSAQFTFAQNNHGTKVSPLSQLKDARSLVTSSVNGGNQTPTGPVVGGDRCGFTTQMELMKANGFNEQAFENIIAEQIAVNKTQRPNAITNYIIPVVFHIIHDGTAEGTGANVSAAQVYQQINQLNRDFGNLSGSTFGVASNTGISFCPVLVDPSGNTLAQPGINRINRITRGWTDPTDFTTIPAVQSYVNANIKPVTIWDPTKYVNVWVYNFINSGLLGYATFPTAGLPDLPGGETATTAGVVFLSGSLGSVNSPGTAMPYALGRTVTHEMGHFFGLRHIWGDVATCGGTDYCADTPPCSDAYYSEVPGCTVPTQCGGPRMIQNYMDYSDDGCMHTFTANQADRIQAVMAAAPRRPRNPASTLCTPPTPNAVSFTLDVTNTNEGVTGTTCPKFRDHVIYVKPAVAASAAATINFTFTGTATRDVDYTIIGSTSMTYALGESGAKSFTVRITDDGAAEPNETIIINYTLGGFGLVAASVNQTHTINIVDDDLNGTIDNTSATTTLLAENFGTAAASGALPTGWIRGSFLSPAGANVWTVNPQYGAATGFTAANGRLLHITNGTAANQTAETATATYSIASASDAVVLTKAINTTGFRNIKLTFDWAALGEQDVDGVYDFGIIRYSTTSQTSGLIPLTDANGDIVILQGSVAKQTITLTLPPAVENVSNLWIGFEWINDDNIGGNPPLIIDNVSVTGDNIGVETVASQTVTQTHGLAQTQQYTSGSGKIIASISNPSVTIGCNTVTVASAGVGQADVVTNMGTYKRSQKVINIVPATANTTATYQLTLYYTTAELAIWGANVPLLKILKVKDGVSLASTLNGGNAQVFATTVDDQRATKGYVAFTASITGGFSQFMLASPTIVIPVTTLAFEARPNGRNIVLDWSTATEINNRGFVIERSTNGTDFTRIGWVDGRMNSNQLIRYNYVDNFVQPNVLYYYRLRQTDIDNREKLSDTKNARISYAVIEVSVSPNPAKDLVKVFVSGSTGLSEINMINAEGQLVKSWKQVNASSAPATLNINGLASGVYMMQIVNAEGTQVQKVIIK